MKDIKICYCKNVTKQQIVDKINQENKTLESITKETKAGIGCGRCIDKIKKIISENI